GVIEVEVAVVRGSAADVERRGAPGRLVDVVQRVAGRRAIDVRVLRGVGPELRVEVAGLVRVGEIDLPTLHAESERRLARLARLGRIVEAVDGHDLSRRDDLALVVDVAQ